MHLSSAVLFILLFCYRVNYRGASFSRNKTSFDEENIFEEFIAEIKLYLEQHDLRHVTVVGASDDQLRQTKPLLEAFPYFIGTDAKKFSKSREFSSKTLVIYFLASLENEEITKVLEDLSNCKKNPVYFIFEGTAVDEVNIEFLLRLAFEKAVKQPVFIHNSGKSVKLYRYIMGPNCSPNVKLFSDWVPGASIETFADWVGFFDTPGCLVPISTMHHPPWMNLAEDANGVTRIIGGLEGEIVSTIARKMNFTPLVKQFKPSDQDRISKSAAIVSYCAAGNALFGIAQIRPTEKVVKAVGISHLYNQEHIVWCVPKITHWKKNVMISEFSWSNWVLIGLMFLASFAVEKLVRNTPYLNRGHANKSGLCSIILDLIGSTIGNPIVYRPLSIGGKVLLIIYICYSMVMTTAYKTSLSSILTTDNSESSIVNVEGIIKANLTTGGDVFKLAILKDQMKDNDFTPKLIKQYVIQTNISNALRRVSNDKNFAFLTSLTDLAYHKKFLLEAGEPVSFDVLRKPVLIYSTVIIFPKSSHLTHEIDKIIKSLTESGLLEYWMRNNFGQRGETSILTESSEMMITQEELHRFTRDKFYQIFSIYCIALIFCIIIFFGELLVHKYKFVGLV